MKKYLRMEGLVTGMLVPLYQAVFRPKRKGMQSTGPTPITLTRYVPSDQAKGAREGLEWGELPQGINPTRSQEGR